MVLRAAVSAGPVLPASPFPEAVPRAAGRLTEAHSADTWRHRRGRSTVNDNEVASHRDGDRTVAVTASRAPSGDNGKPDASR